MKRYRVYNWKQYNQSLVNRGSLDIWFSPELLKKWAPAHHNGHFGRPKIYSDDAITLLIMVKVLFSLPYRALEGFVLSLFRQAGLALPVPNYSHLSRRAQMITLPKKLSCRRPRAIVFDSTGMKIFGEGEWKVKKHGFEKRRRWKKIHIGLCPDTHEIIVAEMTEDKTADSCVLPRILAAAPNTIREVIADGAYDTRSCHQAIHKKGAVGIIPPRKGARVSLAPSPEWSSRNEAAAIIQYLGGDSIAKAIWKKSQGYSRRSLVETAMYRIKGLLGRRLYSRLEESQQTECVLKLLLLNKITSLGMPESSWS